MSWTLCTSGAAIAKAGANANSDIIVYDGTNKNIMDEWSNQAEGFLNAETRYDWIASSGTANFTAALSDVVSSKVANNIIAYDMSGYTSRAEAQTMLDVNENIIRKGIATLNKKENQEKMV